MTDMDERMQDVADFMRRAHVNTILELPLDRLPHFLSTRHSLGNVVEARGRAEAVLVEAEAAGAAANAAAAAAPDAEALALAVEEAEARVDIASERLTLIDARIEVLDAL
jgi:hypothetical protein